MPDVRSVALPRRGFLQMIAAVLALPGAAVAQAPAPPVVSSPPPVPPGTPSSPGPEARLLADVLRTRHPDRLTPEQWASVTSDLDGDLALGRRLRSVKLANADEPDFVFRP